MSENVEICWFNHISDDVLLQILLLLPKSSWRHVRNVCTRFRNICNDKEMFRDASFVSAFGVSETDIQDFLRAGSPFIERLNLNHCYWFTSTALCAAISRCHKIQELYLLDCKITTKGLSRILCSIECLKTLVISISNLLEFSNEINDNQDVQNSLKDLQHFGLHIREEINGLVPASLQFHLSQQTTVIEYCPKLESFCVIGLPEFKQRLSRRLVHPLVVKKQNMVNLKTMSINSTQDATARLYFFGILVKAFEIGVDFKNLSVSGLDLKQAVKKSYFIRSLKASCPSLQYLDLSKVHIDELEASVSIEDAPCLKYLNLSDVRSNSPSSGLLKMASHCPNLVSLNLRSAMSYHRSWGREEIDNLDRVLGACPNLRHLNLSGIHVHSPEPGRSLASIIIKHNIKNLESLALSVCCMGKAHVPEQPKAYTDKGFGKRQRVSRQPQPSTSSAPSDSFEEFNTELSHLAMACRDISSFELINASFSQSLVLSTSNNKTQYVPCKASYMLREHHLYALCGWRKLKYLQLTGLPGVTLDNLLHDVARCCDHLESLSLAYIGLGPVSPHVWDQLKHFRNLRDLRIEQSFLSLDEKLFTACLGCSSLQRLFVISRTGQLQPKVVENYVQQAHKLFMIQVYSYSPKKECEKLQSCLQKRYEKTRPGFLAIIESMYTDKLPFVVASLPLQHLEQMAVLTSRVCSQSLHSVWGQRS